MNELIKIETSQDGKQTVNARDLHDFMEVGKDFSNWIKGRISQFDFTENQDFITYAQKGGGGKFAAIEYHLTLDMAKELSMVERNEKGKQARQYFIECEKRVKEISPALQLAHAVLLAGKMIEDQKLQIAEMQPKADFFDAVAGSTTAVDMAIVAKTLNMGVGRNQLFEILREKAILDRHNMPYQIYCNRGYFRVIESQYNKPDGSSHVSFKTVVFQRGMAFIRELIKEAQ